MQSHKKYVTSIVTLVTLVSLLLFSSLNHAHALKVFAYFEGHLVRGSVYFVGGAPAKQSMIRLLSKDGQVIQTLSANEQGEFESKPVTEAFIKVEADSRDGHLGVWEITQQPLIHQQTIHQLPINQQSIDSSLEALSDKTTVAQVPDSTRPNVTQYELQRLIRQAVALELAPLREELHRFQSSARLSDIIGGIGVIFGLAGGVLWLRSRKQPNE